MNRFRLNSTSMFAWTAALGLFASACSTDDEQLGPPATHSQTEVVTTALDVSDLNAAVGSRIGVAVRVTGATLGGAQGYLSYNSSLLEFAGQGEDVAAATLVGERSGRLNLASFNAAGLPARISVLFFNVRGAGYGTSLRYTLELGATPRNAKLFKSANFAGVFAAADLAVPSTVRRLDVGAWVKLFDPSARVAIQAVPGDSGRIANDTLNAGIRFGNADLSTPTRNVIFPNLDSTGVTIGDALFIANITVGNVQAISGTNSPDVDGIIAADVFPGNAPGLGEAGDAIPPGDGVINISDALDVATEVAGTNLPVVGARIPGRNTNASPAKGIVNVSCPLTGTHNWTKNNVYRLPQGVCFVSDSVGTGPSGVLNIQEGTRVEGDTSSTLVVGRNGQINAIGTRLEPITFTCTGASIGFVPGCWGGLYVNGNAPVNNGTANPSSIRGSTGGLQLSGEGFTGKYGGNDAADNSGTIKYVVIQYAGTRFTTTNERNALTLQAVGTGTTIDFVNMDQGLDDGIEFFGGTVNVKHLYINASQDDGFDWVNGYVGRAQYVIVRGCAINCDNGIEADNAGIDGGVDPESTPRSAPTLWNFTLVGIASPATNNQGFHGMLLRQNTAALIGNTLVLNFKAGVDIDTLSQATSPKNGTICTQIGNGSLRLVSAYVSGNTNGAGAGGNGDSDTGDPTDANGGGSGGATSGQCGGTPTGSGVSVNTDGSNLEALLLAAWGATTASTNATSILRDPFGVVPDYTPLSGALPTGTAPPAGFFTAGATHIGAVPYPGFVGVTVPWYSGWTIPRT